MAGINCLKCCTLLLASKQNNHCEKKIENILKT